MCISGEIAHDEIEEPLEEKFNTTAEWSPGPARPANPTTANGHAAKRKRADMPGNNKKGQVLNSLFLMRERGLEMGWVIGQIYYCLGLREASFIHRVPAQSQPWPCDFFIEGGTDSADWMSVHTYCPPTVWCVAFKGFQSQKQKMTFIVVFSLMHQERVTVGLFLALLYLWTELVLFHNLHICNISYMQHLISTVAQTGPKTVSHGI